MTNIANKIQWGSSPTITASFDYEHQRSGSDMQYRVKISIHPMTGSSSYFGYPIYTQISLAGAVVDSQTLKAASPQTWSSDITYTSAWFTVSNKTSGSTALAVRLYSGSGSSRDQTYTYSLVVDPAKSVVAATNGYAGSPLTISITRYSTAFTHTIKYAFGSASGTIATKTSATSVPWTPPMSLCNQIPYDSRGVGTITCETYNGSTLVGTSTTSVWLSVPSEVQLVLQEGCAVVSPYNTGTKAAGIATFVQGYSKAELTINTAKISTANSYGATPKSYRVSFEGKSIDAAPYRTATLSSAGTKQITLYVTDTRDRTTSITVSFTVHEYSAPKLSDVSAFRCLSNGTASEEGTYISAKAAATFSSLGGNNSVTMKVRYGQVGGSLGSYSAMTSGAASVIGGGNVSTDKSYAVEILLTDNLGQGTVYTDYIESQAVFFQAREGGTAAGFGKAPERDDVLDVAWDLQTRGNLYIGEAGNKVADFVIEEGSSTVGTATWQYRKWNNGRIELWSKQTIESGTFSGTVTNLYYSNTFSLTMPFTLGNDRSIANVSVFSSGATWATTVGVSANKLSFLVGRIYGNTGSISMDVQIYVSGYLA